MVGWSVLKDDQEWGWWDKRIDPSNKYPGHGQAIKNWIETPEGQKKLLSQLSERRAMLDDYPLTGRSVAPWASIMETEGLRGKAWMDSARESVGGGRSGFGLSEPADMPGYAYGLPTGACKSGRHHAMQPGTICSGCYGIRLPNYQMNNTQTAQWRRLHSLTENPSRWASAMSYLIPIAAMAGNTDKHRWHDVGDIQSAQHLSMIADVARNTPTIKHWLPTHEPKMVKDFLAAGGVIPDNLMIRISGDRFGEGTDALAAGYQSLTDHPQVGRSTSGSGEGVICPKSIPGNPKFCDTNNCEACWNPEVANVDYVPHTGSTRGWKPAISSQLPQYWEPPEE